MARCNTTRNVPPGTLKIKSNLLLTAGAIHVLKYIFRNTRLGLVQKEVETRPPTFPIWGSRKCCIFCPLDVYISVGGMRLVTDV